MIGEVKAYRAYGWYRRIDVSGISLFGKNGIWR